MAVANFGNASVTIWDVSSPEALNLTTTIPFTLDQPGPIPSKQSSSKPHQTVLDPTGSFMVVCDFGADTLRIFRVGNHGLVPAGDVKVRPGSGPRHAAFTEVRGGRARLVLVNELSPRIDVFDVKYGEGMELALLSSVPVHGEGTQAPKDAFPSEVVISSDNKFVIVSSRNENNLQTPSFPNNTSQPSDPIISFKLDSSTGNLTDPQEVPAGGRFPRQFSMNAAGTLLAVALQKDERVVLIPRDPVTGKLGDRPVAFARVSGEVTSVIFSGEVVDGEDAE
ncbi:3-carboxymuconate cyclase [Ophiocordyceps camponoti-floridani]|uniref:3-carboxymuconate cyclase n=1 Tax=Ophiocordyceps camponoti-floridani TaxID=2030778 RepID=A0A8H4Q5Q5_9HYPO|nr:3-carboxymuconate cyclase [Ophiocordyceps camponoti-floridani]